MAADDGAGPLQGARGAEGSTASQQLPGAVAKGSRRGRGRGQAGPQQPPLPPRLQELQDAWEVCTATDSDDEERSDDDEDALSIGGHSSRDGGGHGREDCAASSGDEGAGVGGLGSS